MRLLRVQIPQESGPPNGGMNEQGVREAVFNRSVIRALSKRNGADLIVEGQHRSSMCRRLASLVGPSVIAARQLIVHI